MLYKLLMVVALSVVLLLAGCANKDADESNGKLNVVTTTGMIGDIAKNIGGDRINLIGLMGPGVDPHLYKASAGDVGKMQAADLLLYNGLHLEGAMAELFEKMSGSVNTVAVSSGIDDSLFASSGKDAYAHDPHIWFDVSLWILAAKRAEKALIETDPAGEEIYKANAKKYLEELNQLHQYVIDRANELPVEQRILITAHDAFNYFGAAYGFDVRGLQGISTVSEAGTADVQELSTFIAERKIPAVFVESSVPRKAIEALQAAVQNKGFDVQIGGELFSDAMGDPGTPEGNYVGMVKHNINTIVNALSGKSDGGEH